MYIFIIESGELFVKIIDKFLKFLGTDRNTFFTYILTLISIYLVVDRFVELLFLCFTGVSNSYWGPIAYTLAFACPVFAFLFSGSSKFAKSPITKVSFFNLYCIALYILILSMFVSFSNRLAWFLFMLVPNYAEIVTDFPELVGPAFTSLALYLPLTTFYGFFKKLYTWINDSKDIKDSIDDYGGINLSPSPEGIGPYTCEVQLCRDKDTNKVIKIPEAKRFESTLVVGISGMGKTALVFEPMMAQDFEKKFFFRETAKEMGFTALKTGIATLNCPYDNDYLNKNFSLTMLTPNQGKEKLYKAYMHKMLYNDSGELIYKDLGVTYMAPDSSEAKTMLDVAKNFNIPVNYIDPSSLTSIGLNPFVYDDPIKVALIISSILRGMSVASSYDVKEDTRAENISSQVIENLSILLKEYYPYKNEGILPNLEDLFKLLNDFDLIEDMCEEIRTVPEMAEKYNIQLAFMRRNFYAGASARGDMEKNLASIISQLDSLLRHPGVKNILCNRTNNMNFDNAIKNGEVTILCTRRGDLGARVHKAFGLFFLMLMQHSVLTRPGNDKTRIPHYLYIDDFYNFICSATEPIFTVYRKYRVATILSAQNIAQLEGDSKKATYKQTILNNCANKVVFGDGDPDDNAYWEKDFGQKREWKWGSDYKVATGSYDSTMKSIEYGWTSNIKAGKLQSIKFKNCAYKAKQLNGRFLANEGKLDFLQSKYKEPHYGKTFNFSKFTPGMYSDSKEDEESSRRRKFNYKHVNFDDANGEIDPIQTDVSDLDHLFDNENAITFNIKNNSN